MTSLPFGYCYRYMIRKDHPGHFVECTREDFLALYEVADSKYRTGRRLCLTDEDDNLIAYRDEFLPE